MKQGFGHTGPRNLAPGELKWQVRVNLSEKFAAAARGNPQDAKLQPLLDVLAKYDAHLKHQKMAFANFLPYFKNEEQGELLKNIGEALMAMDMATYFRNGKADDADAEQMADALDTLLGVDDTDDVDATLEAAKRLRDVADAFIEQYAENERVQDFRKAVDHFFERYCRLYLWTKETVQKQMVKGENGFYSTRFSIYADGGREVYSKDVADRLEAELAPLKETGMIKVIQKFDSDPANNPQAPAKFHI